MASTIIGASVRISVKIPISILFTHTASLIGGGNKVLLSLFAELDRSRYRPVSILPEHGPMESELRKLDVESAVLDVRPRRGRLSMIKSTMLLVARISREQISLVHANDPFTYHIASLAAGITRTPGICHLHHPDQDAKSIEWAFARRPAVVLTPTQYVKERVCDWLGAGAAEFVHAVGNPIDTKWFAPAQDVGSVRDRVGMLRNVPQITITGALAPHKGHDRFLLAARDILKRHPEAKFNVVGSALSGDRLWAEKIQKLAREIGIEKSVRFWGFVSNSVSRDILAASDIFLLPSKIEGFGLVLAEALACGVPVVSSAIRPLDEIVVDGRAGFLVPPDEVGQFAQRACELLESRELYKKCAEFGKNYVRTNFGAPAVVARIVERYDTILRPR